MSEIKSLNPKQAWNLLRVDSSSVLLDVRDRSEFSLVGHPVGAVNVPWKELPGWTPNPDFIDEVIRKVPNRDTPIFVMCRSGQRSLDAAKALAAAGYTNLANIEEGFEGPIDDRKHRGNQGGWRFNGLPWEQN